VLETDEQRKRWAGQCCCCRTDKLAPVGIVVSSPMLKVALETDEQRKRRESWVLLTFFWCRTTISGCACMCRKGGC